jgi:hypothetical protein
MRRYVVPIVFGDIDASYHWFQLMGEGGDIEGCAVDKYLGRRNYYLENQ